MNCKEVVELCEYLEQRVRTCNDYDLSQEETKTILDFLFNVKDDTLYDVMSRLKLPKGTVIRKPDNRGDVFAIVTFEGDTYIEAMTTEGDWLELDKAEYILDNWEKKVIN